MSAKIIGLQPYPPQGVECSKEIGEWTVRLNGHFIVSFNYWSMTKSEAKAREVAMRLQEAIQ